MLSILMKCESASSIGGRVGMARRGYQTSFWSAAIEMARRDGVNRTAAALRLDGGKLKRLMIAADSISGKTSPPRFVELAPHAVGLPECTIELEGRSGKLRIHWKGATAADLAGLSRALWDAVAS